MIKSVQAILLSILSLSLLTVVISASPATAQTTAPEITLSPAKTTLTYKLAAETTYKESFKLINSGQAEATVKISATPYSVQDSSYTPDFSKYNHYNQLSRWITFPVDSYQLEPGQEVIVNYQIKTPSSLPDGDQYAMLMASMSSQQSSQSGAQVETKSQVGIKLLAHTTGKTNQQVKVDLPKVPVVIVASKYRLPIDIHNQGNVDYVSQYSLRITSLINGHEVLSKSGKVQVIPETTRTVDLTWSILQNLGLYRVEVMAATSSGMVKTTKNILTLTPLGLIALTVILIVVIAVVLRFSLKPRQRQAGPRRKPT